MCNVELCALEAVSSGGQTAAVGRTAQWGDLHSGTDCTVNSMRKQEMRWPERVAHMEENRNARRFSVEKSEEKRPLGRPRHRS